METITGAIAPLTAMAGSLETTLLNEFLILGYDHAYGGAGSTGTTLVDAIGSDDMTLTSGAVIDSQIYKPADGFFSSAYDGVDDHGVANPTHTSDFAHTIVFTRKIADLDGWVSYSDIGTNDYAGIREHDSDDTKLLYAIYIDDVLEVSAVFDAPPLGVPMRLSASFARLSADRRLFVDGVDLTNTISGIADLGFTPAVTSFYVMAGAGAPAGEAVDGLMHVSALHASAMSLADMQQADRKLTWARTNQNLHMQAVMSVDQTTGINPGDPFRFNTADDGNLGFNAGTYRWEVKAYEYYLCRLSERADAAYIVTRVRNYTTSVNSSEYGVPREVSYSSLGASAEILHAPVIPSADAEIGFILDTRGGLTTINAGETRAMVRQAGTEETLTLSILVNQSTHPSGQSVPWEAFKGTHGVDIVPDNDRRRVLLKAGGAYIIEAQLGCTFTTTSSAARTQWGLYNHTASAYIGAEQNVRAVIANVTNRHSESAVSKIIQPTVDTHIGLRPSLNSSLSVYTTASFMTVRKLREAFAYQELTVAHVPVIGEAIKFPAGLGTIPYDPVTGQWSLTAGKTYRMRFEERGAYTTTGYTQTKLHDITADVNLMQTLNYTMNSSGEWNTHGIDHVFTPAVDTEIAFVPLANSNLSSYRIGTLATVEELTESFEEQVSGSISKNAVMGGEVGLGHYITGDVSEAEALAGGVAVNTDVAGEVTETEALAGAFDITSTIAGAVTEAESLAGAFDINTDIAGDVTETETLAGGVAVNTDIAGAVAETEALAGSLPVIYPIAGAVTETETLSGTFDVNADIVGGITETAVSGGEVESSIQMTGDITGTEALSGALTIASLLMGAVAETETLAGAFDINTDITGAVAETATLAGAFATASEITGDITEAEALTGALTLNTDITGAVTETEALSGTLPTTYPVEGAVTETEALAGAFDIASLLTGDTVETATLAGALELIDQIAGDVAETATVGGAFLVDEFVEGAITSTATLTVTWIVAVVTKTPDLTATSTLGGSLYVEPDRTSINALLTMGGQLQLSPLNDGSTENRYDTDGHRPLFPLLVRSVTARTYGEASVAVNYQAGEAVVIPADYIPTDGDGLKRYGARADMVGVMQASGAWVFRYPELSEVVWLIPITPAGVPSDGGLYRWKAPRWFPWVSAFERTIVDMRVFDALDRDGVYKYLARLLSAYTARTQHDNRAVLDVRGALSAPTAVLNRLAQTYNHVDVPDLRSGTALSQRAVQYRGLTDAVSSVASAMNIQAIVHPIYVPDSATEWDDYTSAPPADQALLDTLGATNTLPAGTKTLDWVVADTDPTNPPASARPMRQVHVDLRTARGQVFTTNSRTEIDRMSEELMRGVAHLFPVGTSVRSIESGVTVGDTGRDLLTQYLAR